MNIYPVTSFRSNFTSYSREVKNSNQKNLSIAKQDILWRNNTSFFRSDISWDEVCRFLNNRYQNTDKVNVYCYGCSDGSEPYTLIMQLKTLYNDDKCNKFFPINAIDRDDFIISKAKSGIITIPIYEETEINSATRKNFDKYFALANIPQDLDNKVEGLNYKTSDGLRENVKFRCANIMNDINSIEPDNSVVLARNFWPYLEWHEISKLVQALSKKMGKNSHLILGNYDRNYTNVVPLLLNNRFNMTDYDNNIYSKIY